MARTAVTNATREYPYALVAVVTGPADLPLPRDRHPAFHGCYDWHSAVHTHWLLVRLLRRHADSIDAGAAHAVLDAHLTPAHLATEAAVLADQPSFERPYGWAWLVALAAECRAAVGEVEAARVWADALEPAADVVVGLVLDWLPRAGRPVRDGTHASTAFALGLLLDAAGPLRRDDLTAAVEAYVREWFVPDRDAPLRWEPSGQDFLSPGLSEADLVRRVLDPVAFAAWLDGFWPGLAAGEPRSLLEPVVVRDRTDGQLGHLDGLNLSRAWSLARLGLALDVDDPRRAVLEDAAQAHRGAGLPALAEDGYLSTHWLGTFAMLALEPAG
ncbi:DUF2891 domain-containing protein [Microlunatus antarcticus]|nr:DUF2891 domain-containing protein [Microlunatus antarcticus]